MTNETNRPVEIGQGDHERIWLEPLCQDGSGEGRLWSQHKLDDCDDDECGLPAVEYIRADIAARHAASAREEALKDAADFLFGEAAGALADEAERDSFVLTNAAQSILALSIVGEGGGLTDQDRAIPSGRAVVNGAGQAVSAVPASVPIADDYDDYLGEGCYECGGEGFVSDCVEEWACIDPEYGCDYCTRRCPLCNQPKRDPALDAVLAEALAQGIEAQSATTAGRGPQDESPVPQECAHPAHPTGSDDDRRRG